MSEHIILVAFSVESRSRDGAEAILRAALAESENVRTFTESWWVTEDDFLIDATSAPDRYPLPSDG